MPKNKVSDPITDQEIAFARLVLSGTMTDRHAAEAVGLNPDSAAYTKSKPRVRAYMLEHRAAVQQQLVQQEADLSRRAVDGLHRINLDREQVLARLWEIANLSPDMTRNSITGQVKAISMIIAMQNFIPDRRAVSSEKQSAPAPAPQIYASAWLRGQQATTIHPQPDCRPSPRRRFACPPRLSRRAVGRSRARARSRIRIRGSGASRPWPQPVKLRQPLWAFGSTATGLLCPRHHLCSRLESSFLHKKEPLCPPPLSYQS